MDSGDRRCRWCGRVVPERELNDHSTVGCCNSCRRARTTTVKCAACGRDTATDEGHCLWCQAECADCHALISSERVDPEHADDVNCAECEAARRLVLDDLFSDDPANRQRAVGELTRYSECHNGAVGEKGLHVIIEPKAAFLFDLDARRIGRASTIWKLARDWRLRFRSARRPKEGQLEGALLLMGVSPLDPDEGLVDGATCAHCGKTIRGSWSSWAEKVKPRAAEGGR